MMSKSVLHLDLHPIARRGDAIDDALDDLFETAVHKRVKSAEIIPGKGTGQLMKRVKKYLDRKEVKALYKRVEVDTKNHGRLFVHFR
jgi:dsDNA-specific endonuclease/ATPase MutS2